MKNFIAILLLCNLAVEPFAQPADQPRVGEKMPDFELRVNNKKTSLQDYSGRWLILDFWAQSCRACFDTFPKANQMQLKFHDNLDWVLVGYTGGSLSRGIEKVYDRVAKRQNLTLRTAYDSVFFNKWGISSVPHIFIIDPNGVLTAVTGGRDITAEKIAQMIQGVPVSFYPKNSEYSVFDPIKQNTDLLNVTLLARWNGEAQNAGFPIDAFINLKTERAKGWSVSMLSLAELYNYAYLGKSFWYPNDTTLYGKYFPSPILNLKDTTSFNADYTFNVGQGTYNFYFKSSNPKLNKADVMTALQESLQNTFDYQVNMEQREMPVWKVVSTRPVKKKSTNDGIVGPYFSGGNVISGFTVKNYPIKNFIQLLTANLPNANHLPYINETGISTINFSIDTDMTDLESIRKILTKNGLDIVKSSKTMKVMVIRD